MKRLSNGRFATKELTSEDISIVHETIRPGRSFYSEVTAILSTIWRIWQMLPLFIIAFIAWRYLHIRNIFEKLLVDTACGEGCFCSCAANNTFTVETVKNGF